MGKGQIFLVLVAAAVIGFASANLSTASHGDGHSGGGHGAHSGGYSGHSDGHGGTWHFDHDKVRHCTGPGSGADKTAATCSDWQ